MESPATNYFGLGLWKNGIMPQKIEALNNIQKLRCKKNT
jgi:hypothetical protein